MNNLMEGKMSIKKVIGITVVCLAFAGQVFAQGQAPAGGQGGQQGGMPQMSGGQGGAPGGQGSGSSVDMTPTFTGMDKNSDGKVTKEEFLASGMTESIYNNLFVNMLDKNKDGVMTKDELGVPLFDVDTNKDGKCSVEEFVAANKDAEAQRTAGGGQSGAQGAQQGGAPGGQGGAPAGAAPSK
jgi:hypothetical protein